MTLPLLLIWIGCDLCQAAKIPCIPVAEDWPAIKRGWLMRRHLQADDGSWQHQHCCPNCSASNGLCPPKDGWVPYEEELPPREKKP